MCCFQAMASPNPLGSLAGLGQALVLIIILIVMVILLIGFCLTAIFKKSMAFKSMKKVNRIMWVLTALSLMVLALFAWDFYPTDKEFMMLLLMIYVAIHLWLFAINQILKKTGKVDINQ